MCPVGREARTEARTRSKGAREKQEVRAQQCNSAQCIQKKQTTNPSRKAKPLAQAVVGKFLVRGVPKNPQLSQKKCMIPLDKNAKRPMMWQEVVRSGWQ